MPDKVYKLLLKLSRKAIKHNEVPVAAVLVADGMHIINVIKVIVYLIMRKLLLFQSIQKK